jgi:hypothetical protein
MRVVAVTYAAVAALAMWSAALAQDNTGQSSAGSSGNAQTTGQANSSTGQPNMAREAPIGHRQPRAKDLPPGIDQNLGARSPEDAAIDRKLRICRDC